MTSNISNTRRWFNIAFPIVCYFVFAYPVSRLANWYDGPLEITLLHAVLIWVIGFTGMYYSFSGPKMKVRYVVVHWMGASFIFACITLLAEPIRLFSHFEDRSIVIAVIGISLFLVLLAVLISHHLAVKRLSIKSGKLSRGYRVVQISDVHIGSRQGGYMRRIVNKLNRLQPDFVVVTGDLIDSSAVDYEALESIGDLKAKTFFTIGNHERYADLDKILAIADRLGMQTLRQSTQVVDDLLFIGIDDADRRDQVDINLPGIENLPEKFSLLLYHRPVGWEAAIAHGVDLMLCGHTHNGQIFPFNLVVKQQFNRIKGLYKSNTIIFMSRRAPEPGDH